MNKKGEILKAAVTGEVKWDNNRPFSLNLTFTMHHNANDYGTGNYILMEAPEDKTFTPQYYDVRYSGTSGIKKLAKIAANTFFGENLKSFKVVK